MDRNQFKKSIHILTPMTTLDWPRIKQTQTMDKITGESGTTTDPLSDSPVRAWHGPDERQSPTTSSVHFILRHLSFCFEVTHFSLVTVFSLFLKVLSCLILI